VGAQVKQIENLSPEAKGTTHRTQKSKRRKTDDEFVCQSKCIFYTKLLATWWRSQIH